MSQEPDRHRVYVDSVEVAMERRAAEKRRPAVRTARNKRQLADVLLRRLRAAEQLAKMQRDEIGRLREAKVVPPIPFVQAFNATTRDMTQLCEQVRRCREAEKDNLGGLSNDELDDVLRAHLPRLAKGMLDEDKRVMLLAWFGAGVTAVLLAGEGAAATGGVQ